MSSGAVVRRRREAKPRRRDETDESSDSMVEQPATGWREPRWDFTTKAKDVTLLVDEDKAKKWQSFKTRTIYTLLMIVAFLGIVFGLKQPGCCALVFVLQAIMYGELVALMFKHQVENEMPMFRRLYYYWFLVCTFFVYGRALMPHFEVHEFDRVFGLYFLEKGFIVQHHTAISFALYVVGFVSFVFSLRKRKHYKYQFSQFAFCHVALLMIVAQSTFMISNMFEGLIWFLLPCSLIIVNDVFAYIFGFFWGRTPLIPKLSPKKTWEGFIGAYGATVLWSMGFSRFMAQYEMMVCPQVGFHLAFKSCTPAQIFVPLPLQAYPTLSQYVPEMLHDVTIAPIQYHMVFFAIFASIVAPFGGFFASGFKRAFKIKDFGTSIPGHGGVVDRMDCQIIMGMFTFVYFTNFIQRPDRVSNILRVLERLTNEEQLVVFQKFQHLLLESGILD
ncbi:hypothetical protein SPRG_14247 [Saprolegnia parasitica CBS 223.65]|uniref:Phosphatidate cytidylyltransferase n=1 Tax=Saprolegnia parasitica (strain CBS 223.65) TaxID=695850 RepID=A0A067BSE1_SAPPC|nr:hypothetical protein SPRG_14247 [Saprolegnia parasitica CBS 223.65]KDO19720.1 hypothetical protein SPRG_14247 [Saprolegnia parasitica CBS 223.65]|eukprot:XP_012209579.1 hypothetical protein SPRG_14247 [Saprolegnia parasitica CBS 223.65]